MIGSIFAVLDRTGRSVIHVLEELGGMLFLFVSIARWAVSPPFKIRQIMKQMEFVGVKSLFVVILTGLFTGMVSALQGYHGFKMFSAESLVGSTVALAMTRELGPVLTSLMVTARAGSAMAAELGTMKVTEQIDALYVMASNPVKHLIVPRVIAGVIMLPALTIVSDFVGIFGSYFVGVGLLDINKGMFIRNMTKFVDLGDIYNGLVKAAVFGLILSFIGCYKGFKTTGGAEGVGKATTEAVVISAITILICDYFLTALMF
ncbi:MAG: ABC transporter permease [Syntrophales bacterium]|jgi:phospholipid/cholesterol/gamma-HCH transport system permease protein|nr:ABC transporter permease [Syntrophales bacterium]MDY0044080.1 ABC transporter permease [Syntrophales bacterium]